MRLMDGEQFLKYVEGLKGNQFLLKLDKSKKIVNCKKIHCNLAQNSQ